MFLAHVGSLVLALVGWSAVFHWIFAIFAPLQSSALAALQKIALTNHKQRQMARCGGAQARLLFFSALVLGGSRMGPGAPRAGMRGVAQAVPATLAPLSRQQHMLEVEREMAALTGQTRSAVALSAVRRPSGIP